MKNILVTIDFEKEINVLIDKAFELATRFDSKLWLIHVAPPDPDFVAYKADPENEIDFKPNERSVVQQYVQQLSETGINAEGILVKGPIVETILKEIEKLHIDLVIIGHHRHGLLYKTFVGNTDSSLINKSKIPVLLVPLNDGFISEPSPIKNEELTIAF